MTETTITDVAKGRSGYGSAPLTVSVYNFDPSLGCDDATFQPCSPRALSSLKVVGEHFKQFFPLSRNFTEDQPPYYGFFTEDRFIGGHVSSDIFQLGAGSRTHLCPSHSPNSSLRSTRLSNCTTRLPHGTSSVTSTSHPSRSSSGINLIRVFWSSATRRAPPDTKP